MYLIKDYKGSCIFRK